MIVRYKRILGCLVFCLSVCGCSLCSAQDTTITFSKYASVKEETKIVSLAAKYDEYNNKKEFADGYRIQIMYTDIRSDAYKNKGQMYKDFPDLKSYVEYEEPSYKLRIGDFKTRLEATFFMQQVTPLYPGAFIVKDKIRIRQ
jgi:sporulation related protein